MSQIELKPEWSGTGEIAFNQRTIQQLVEHSLSDAFCLKDANGRYRYCNPAMAKLLGRPSESVIGLSNSELRFHSDTLHAAEQRVLQCQLAETVVCKFEFDAIARWFDVTLIPTFHDQTGEFNGIGQTLHEITESYLERGLYHGQSRILQRIATGSDLDSVLADITQLVEELMPEAMCAVLIRDKTTNTLRPGPSSRVPEEFIRCFPSVPIQEGIGSCGTAAFRGQSVISADIEHDPLWHGFSATAMQYGLRSCWSVPIFATSHQPRPTQVLGSFAVYGRQPREPRPDQLKVMQVAAYLAGIAIDISERQLAETARQQTARVLSAVASSTRDAIFVKDLDGKYLFFNQAAAEFVGKSVEEVLGLNDHCVFDEQSADALREIDQGIMQSNEPRSIEETLTAAGTTRTYLVFKAPYRDEDGRVIGLIGISRDITERKQTEAALVASEERYRMAISATHDYIWDVDLRTPQVTCSDRYEQVFGRSQEVQYSWQWWIDHIHPDDRERTVDFFNAAIASDQQYCSCDYRLLRKDGTWADVQDRAYIARDEQGLAYRMVGAMKDVTLQKQSELLQNRLLRLIDQSNDFIVLADMLGRLTFMNAGGKRMIGADEDTDITQLNLGELAVGSDQARVWQEIMSQVFEKGLWQGEMQFRHQKDGRLIDVHRTIFLIRDEYGTPCLASVTRDITLAKRADKELRATQQTVHAVLAASPLTIYVLDLQAGQFRFATWQLMVELGFASHPRVELSWQEYQSLIHPDDLAGFLKVLEHCQQAGDAFVSEHEYRIRDSKGVWKWINCRHVAYDHHLDDSGARHIIGTAQDVTARKELEQHVRESQKADAIGRLAGGVAHDFNNLLTIINGQTDRLLSQLRQDNVLQSGLKEVRDAGQRAAQLTRQLLSFGRRALIDPQVLDLSLIVAESAHLIRRFLGEHIHLELDLESTNAYVIADASQIDQLILNLVVNARDAMPQGGTLTIVTRRVNEASMMAMHIPDAAAGEYIQMIVRDTGMGMTAEVIERAFEPFFTTKPTGQGTGLGLAVVHGIVKQTGGHISLHSKPNAGSEFTIWLPATNDPPKTSETIHQHEQNSQPARAATILVVEDEPGVRTLLRQLLEEDGYCLLEACDPEDAEQLLSQYGSTIDLLITDIVMPNSDGRTLASKLRVHDPTLPVLYITGYSNQLPLAMEPGASYDRLLQKPFSPTDLRSTVANMLKT